MRCLAKLIHLSVPSPPQFIHGIQYIPFTPMSEVLLPPAFMLASYNRSQYTLRRPEPPIQEGFR